MISIDLETYVAPSVGAEMPSQWHQEALKAQAVAARSYADGSYRKTSNDDLSRGRYNPLTGVRWGDKHHLGQSISHVGDPWHHHQLRRWHCGEFVRLECASQF